MILATSYRVFKGVVVVKDTDDANCRSDMKRSCDKRAVEAVSGLKTCGMCFMQDTVIGFI